jgi:hypothetical protein
MPIPRHSRSGIAQRTRRLGVSLLAALAVAAILSPAMPTPATAAPITYTLSNASATSASGTLTFTGTFTFDPSTSTLDSVSITATASPTTLLTISPELFTSPITATLLSIAFQNSSTHDTLNFYFTNDLDTVSDSFRFISVHYPSLVDLTSTSGAAVPTTTPIPEPTSLALLGGALGLFMLARRLSWSGHRA